MQSLQNYVIHDRLYSLYTNYSTKYAIYVDIDITKIVYIFDI